MGQSKHSVNPFTGGNGFPESLWGRRMSGGSIIMIFAGVAAMAVGLVQVELRASHASPLWSLLIPAGLVSAIVGTLVVAVPDFFS